MNNETNKLIGASVAYRYEGHDFEGYITGLHWMPSDPGFNPNMVATIMLSDGKLTTKFLNQLKVTNPQWVLAAD